jgi:hypothetical protein
LLNGRLPKKPLLAVALHSQKCIEFLQYFINGCRGQPANQFGLARFPIQTFHLIRQYHSANLQVSWYRDLKWITLDLARDGAENCQAHLAVISGWGQNESRPSASLLMSCSRVERKPYRIPSIWYVGHIITRPHCQHLRRCLLHDANFP